MDLETGAVVAVILEGGAAGDTQTIRETLPQAGEHIAEAACATNNQEVGERVQAEGPQEVVADKGYHSNDTLQALEEAEVRSYISEPARGRRCWQGKRRLSKRCIATGGGFVVSTGKSCCAAAGNCWNAVSPTRMKPEECGACTCGDEKIFSNGS